MTTLTKVEVAERIVEHVERDYHKEITKQASMDMVDCIVNTMKDAFRIGSSVALRSFGTLRVNSKPARPGRNPKTGIKYTIAARTVVTLTQTSAEFKTNYSELIETVATVLMIPNSLAKIAMDAFLSVIKDVRDTQGLRLEIRGFGVFANKPKKARIARNPKTGAQVEIPAGTKLHFKCSKAIISKEEV